MPTKVHLVKTMIFPVVMYGCESWTIKKAECRRIDAFELCCWRRLLRVPWTARGSNQSILKEISLGCSLEGLMLNWPPQAKNWLIGKDHDAGKDWRQEEKETTEDEMVGWHHQLYEHEFGWTPGVGDGQGGLACCEELHMTEWLNRTELDLTSGMWASLVLACRLSGCGFWASGILVPWPGIESGPPAIGSWSLSHWTLREVPKLPIVGCANWGSEMFVA